MTFTYRGIFGTDISTYQDSPSIPGTVNFQMMRDYGVKFCIMRASIGDVFDVDFQTYWRNSKGYLLRSAYHYYRQDIDPKIQALRFWTVIQNDPPEGVVWLDCEEGDTETWRGWYDFIEEFKRLSGWGDDRIGIYTGYYIWTQVTTYATNAQKAYFGKFKLWMAWYFEDPFNPIYSVVRIPYPWSEIDILQSGTPAIGRDVGVESLDVDYNHLNGDGEKLTQLFGGISQPPEGETMSYFKVTASVLNLRSSAAVVNSPTNDIGDVYANDVLKCSDTTVLGSSTTWREVTEIWRNNAPVALPASPKVWVAAPYLVATTFVPPAPEPALPSVLYIGTTPENVTEYRRA